MAIVLSLRVTSVDDLDSDFQRIINLATNVGLAIEFSIMGVKVVIYGDENRASAIALVKQAIGRGDESVDLSSART